VIMLNHHCRIAPLSARRQHKPKPRPQFQMARFYVHIAISVPRNMHG
jgi:hypothetical protein